LPPLGGLRTAYDSLKAEAPLKIADVVALIDEKFKVFDILAARDIAMENARNCNNWLAKLEPWKMKDDQNEMRQAIVLMTLECCYILAHILAPFLPVATTEICKRLGTMAVPAADLKLDFENLKSGTDITIGDPLFARLTESGAAASAEDLKNGKMKISNAEAVVLAKQAKEAKKLAMKQAQEAQKKEKAAAAAAASGGGSDKKEDTKTLASDQQNNNEGKKKNKKDKNKDGNNDKKGKGGGGGGGDASDEVCGLDIRVGIIENAWEHPNSDKLWCETINIGEKDDKGNDKKRSICSGLRLFYKNATDLIGRKVLVVANLKPRTMGGFSSEGMVLCASSPSHDIVKFIEPPVSSKIGDVISFEGLSEMKPLSPNQITKKKIAEKIIFGGQLYTITKDGDDSSFCTFNGVNKMQVEGCDYCTAPVPEKYIVS